MLPTPLVFQSSTNLGAAVKDFADVVGVLSQ